jgi:hypothetical protein
MFLAIFKMKEYVMQPATSVRGHFGKLLAPYNSIRKIEAANLSESPSSFYQPTRRHIQEDGNIHIHNR